MESRRPVWPNLLLGALCLATPAASQAPSGERPNVVLIMADDLGYGDLGVNGATDIRTPNIDGLARDGVTFTDFYANGATCTPTRAALITGRYQQRFALEAPLGAGGRADWERGLPVNGQSLPQLLVDSGYATALVGKWHLGWEPSNSPNAHGFGYFFGFKSGYVDYYQHTAPRNAPLRHDLFENDQPVEVVGYMTDLITERSVEFIERHRDRPFFIDVAYNAPHWPYQLPGHPSVAPDSSRHLGPFDDSTGSRDVYVAMVERLDHGVGVILEALDRLGLRDNTIVVFTGDNGGEWLSRNDPFFHNKGTVWEGGIRVPGIIRWPARIAPGTVSSQVGVTMDLTASIVAVTGSQPASGSRLEGMDLFPTLEGNAPPVERTLFWRVQGPRSQVAVRSGNWKLVVDGTGSGPIPRAMLFDLATDPQERTNLVVQQPDVSRRLWLLLQGWQQEVDASAVAAAGPSDPEPAREPAPSLPTR
jgi:arylsulfatase A-like enzyme